MRFIAISERIGLMPEVKRVVERLETKLNEPDFPHMYEDIPLLKDTLFVFGEDGGQVLCANSEDGSSATVWNTEDKQWYYRGWMSEGPDTLVPGGEEEVIANWLCYYTG